MKVFVLATACLLFSANPSVFAKPPAKGNDDLVGSTFVCPGSYGKAFTFFPNNKFTAVINNRSVTSRITPISYSYDGEHLSITYIGVDGGSKRTSNYDVTYLKNKGKLIMKDENGNEEICDER